MPAADSLSGIVKMRFSNDNSNWSTWEDYASIKENWLLADSNGYKKVFVQYKDNAENISRTLTDKIFYFSLEQSAIPTVVGGQISQDTTWTPENNPYVIDSPSNSGYTLTVNPGVTLTIEPGVVIKLKDNFQKISVLGTLNAVGAKNKPIVFTSFKDDRHAGDTNQDGNLSQPQPGNWNSLNFFDGSQNSQFKNVEVYYGGSSPGYFAVRINGPTLAIDNCRFINNNDGINIAGGAPSTIINSIFENNRNGIYLSQTSGVLVKNNLIRDSRENGIYAFDASALIVNNSINNNANYAIYNRMYEGFSVPTISYNDIFLNGSSSGGDIWNGWYDAGRGDPLINANYNYWGSSTIGPEYIYGTSNDPWSQFPYTSEGQIYYQALGGLDDSLPYLSSSHSPYKYFGDPVNVSTGNFAHEEKDISISTKGLPLEFVRYYNSLNSSYKDAQLGYGWTHNYNTALRFDENGAVTVMYPDGKRRTFSFDGNNYIPSQEFKDKLEKNPDGSFTLTFFSQVKYKYNSNGRLVSQEDKYGNITNLEYSGNGYLWRIKAPDYDQSYKDIRIDYNSKQLISRVYEFHSSEAVYFSYDNDDNLISVTAATKNRPWSLGAEGKTTTYTYANHQLETITEPGATNPIVRNTYLDGMVISQKDAYNNTTAFSYDADNSKSVVTDNRGYKTTHSYNSQFWVTDTIDPLNNATKYNYGDLNKPLEIIDQRGNTSSFSYDANGNAAEAADPKGYTTKANYDLSNNNLIWQEDALARRTSYSYDATGKFLEKINSPIGTTSFSYYPDGLLNISIDPRGNTTGYNYDSSGNPSRIIDARGASTTLAYSPTGKLTSSQDALGNTTRYGYDYYTDNLTSININNNYIRFNYDDRGNLTEFSDHYYNSTKFVHDDMNLLKSVIDANGMTTSYSYDQNYNLSQVVNARSHTTAYSYDANNRLSSVIDQLGRTINYFYDASSNLVKTVFPNGDETYYGYDKTNMLTDISYKNDTTSYNLEYNPTSTLKKVTDNTGKEYNYLYDNGDRLTKATDQNNPLISQFAVTMEYDPNSNLTGIKAGNDMTASYSYDQVSNLTGIDLPGGSANEISSTYNLVRNPAQSYTPGATTSYQYDAANKITNLTNDSKDASYQGLRRIYTYSYDSIGNITKEQLKRTVGTNSSDSQTRYTYDKLNRLTDWFNQDNNMTTSYSYDNTGNLLTVKENGATTKSLSYNSADQISNTGYQYDFKGNLTEDSNYYYDYDVENRLEKVTDKVTSQVIAEYTYDFMGRRTSATNSSGATTYFHYNGLSVVAESDGTGAITTRYYYDDKGQVQAMEHDSNTYYYQFNARGDVVSLTNEQGQIVNEYKYDPWGNPTSTNETVSNPYRYAGYRYDSDTGLYYLNARYYSPKNYRFLTSDKFAGNTKTPHSLNKYLYVENNPINRIDPLGLWYIDINVSGGFWVGATGGVLINDNGVYPYFGQGLITPGIGGSITWSSSDPTPGWNFGIQGSGIIAGQLGYALDGGRFTEVGFGGSFPMIWGFSYMPYMVFPPLFEKAHKK